AGRRSRPRASPWRPRARRGGLSARATMVGAGGAAERPWPDRRRRDAPSCSARPRAVDRPRSASAGFRLLVLLVAELGHHDLALLLGHLGVLLGLHRELALALRRRAEVRRVAEHVVEGHLGHGLDEALLLLRRDDRPATLVELAHDGALEL